MDRHTLEIGALAEGLRDQLEAVARRTMFSVGTMMCRDAQPGVCPESLATKIYDRVKWLEAWRGRPTGKAGSRHWRLNFAQPPLQKSTLAVVGGQCQRPLVTLCSFF
jgi:hypothetical protein